MNINSNYKDTLNYDPWGNPQKEEIKFDTLAIDVSYLIQEDSNGGGEGSNSKEDLSNQSEEDLMNMLRRADISQQTAAKILSNPDNSPDTRDVAKQLLKESSDLKQEILEALRDQKRREEESSVSWNTFGKSEEPEPTSNESIVSKTMRRIGKMNRWK